MNGKFRTIILALSNSSYAEVGACSCTCNSNKSATIIKIKVDFFKIRSENKEENLGCHLALFIVGLYHMFEGLLNEFFSFGKYRHTVHR